MALDLIGGSTKAENKQTSAADNAVANLGNLISPTIGSAFIIGGNSNASAGGAGTALGAASSGDGATIPWTNLALGAVVVLALVWWFNRKK